MTEHQAQLMLSYQQYVNGDLLTQASFMQAEWFLGCALLAALLCLIVVVGVLNRPRYGG